MVLERNANHGQCSLVFREKSVNVNVRFKFNPTKKPACLKGISDIETYFEC